ncbi:hypothetical protein DCS_04187 [Drechmeria coniospora]|uniref:cAMP-independent regulatory protein pac2 n=1 Tax=Drechmeria coniospora TaxID=98403 RepID=A0A151GJ97_DRECN|nr:hypothetical protein DCS_04187 [Drechmeria coniospora]KYK57180.1 hypothetical protein DCS_04187 [Drechmeria coniospora]ODA79088.1 hypothetical protein RJ55_04679 [Drechmeria coniospora]
METYHGYVRTPADAIKLFEACRLGLLPRVQRRLSEKERQSIRSGSVFVWDEREAGMRRWTDGKSWSASRVSGSFLTYREMEGKRGGGFGSSRRGAGKTPDSGRGSDDDHDDGEPEGYRYKADGLMKQSFSITTSTGQHLHLISYYSRPQPGQPDLPQPSSDPSLRGISPPKGMYPESNLGETIQTPALTRTPMQQPYMMPPGHAHGHHPQPYPPHFGQTGYAWPPSPAVTPPYGQFAQAPYPPSVHQLPHPHSSHAPPPSQAPAYPNGYPHATPPAYDRGSLTPLHSQAPGPMAPLQTRRSSHGTPLPAWYDGAAQTELPSMASAAAAEAQAGGEWSQRSLGPLPALNTVTQGAYASSHGSMATPPTRHLSVSPPKLPPVERLPVGGGGRTSLSALLHPTPSSSECGSVGAGSHGSASSSPRAKGAGAPSLASETIGVSEDARALRMLDRKFCV